MDWVKVLVYLACLAFVVICWGAVIYGLTRLL